MDNNKGEAMYSDDWLKQGYITGDRVMVNGIVDYYIWLDTDGEMVGVAVNFEAADDFHYELLTEDWHSFLTKVLNVSDIAYSTEAFCDFLAHRDDLFAFEEALNCHSIKFKKISFY
ncbi:hypothetical protein JR334_07740 [Clostridia bacterium]|nr:hypothetical protein JR334_07740 [Clostridia bacterium]